MTVSLPLTKRVLTPLANFFFFLQCGLSVAMLAIDTAIQNKIHEQELQN